MKQTGLLAALTTLALVGCNDSGGDTSPGHHELADQVLYSLNYNYDQSDVIGVICNSWKFENGNIYISDPSNVSTANVQCPEPTINLEDADIEYLLGEAPDGVDVSFDSAYRVNGDVLLITLDLHFSSQGQSVTQSSTVSYQVDESAPGDEIAPGTYTVVSTYSEENYTGGSRNLFFTDKASIEKRLNIQSNASQEDRFFNIHYPTVDGDYLLGRVGVSLTEDDGAMQSTIVFENVSGADLTCDKINTFYESFSFAGSDIGENYSSNCTEDGDVYINFDLPDLTVGNVYSILGMVNESGDMTIIQPIEFNIKWNGTVN